MKTLVVVTVAAAAWLVPCAASACECCDHHQHGHAAAHASAPATAQLAPGEARVRIPVTGMHCGHCVSRVEAALSKIEGVKRADASLKGSEAIVVFDKSKVTSAKLVETIDQLGFKAGTRHRRYTVPFATAQRGAEVAEAGHIRARVFLPSADKK